MTYDQHTWDLTRISQLVVDRAKERLKVKMEEDRAKIESLEAEPARLQGVARKVEKEINTTKTNLVTLESLRQKLWKTLVTTEHQFYQIHSRFEEVERIWREEFTTLANRLNEQQRILSYTLAYKLFGLLTFGEFINSCAKAQINGVVIEALEMVKDDYLDVDVA